MQRRRTAVLAACTIVLLGAVGFFMFRNSGLESQIPDVAEHAHTYICAEDGHTFTLTPKALHDALQEGTARVGTRIDRQPLRVQCPQCEKLTARRAGTCPNCGAWCLADRPCAECGNIAISMQRP